MHVLTSTEACTNLVLYVLHLRAVRVFFDMAAVVVALNQFVMSKDAKNFSRARQRARQAQEHPTD